MPHGIDQITAQVARKLKRATDGFSRDGKAALSLPELQAVQRRPTGFTVRIRTHLRTLQPNLAERDFELSMRDGKLRFSLGPQET